MNLEIGFQPNANDIYPNQTRGFFDSVLNPSKQTTVLNDTGSAVPANWGSSLALASAGLSMYASTAGSLTQIDNIMANVHRTERNIDQIQIEMMDTLNVQARKVSRRHGTQMARVGASGVGFSGSPLLIMAESHKRGMEDYAAIEQKGRFAIDSAYQSIYDSLDQAQDVAKSIFFNSAVSLASGVSGYHRAGSQ